MFDLPKDTALQQLIANIYQQHGVVAAVCHGPAALVNVKLADGSYLLAGKAVNGFTNQEERLFGKKWLSTFEFGKARQSCWFYKLQFKTAKIKQPQIAADPRFKSTISFNLRTLI